MNKVILWIMVFFMLIGGMDKLRGNKLGYGEKFDEGFHALGPLTIAMLGMITLAPVLNILLRPILIPLFSAIGADPSIFAGILLGSDMGGYPLAMELANSESLGFFSGLIVSSMMGAVIVFTIPVALSIIEKEDTYYFATGVLIGVTTIPIGCIVGGLAMNLTSLKISFLEILINTFPILILSIIIVAGLFFFTNQTLHIFLFFGKWIRHLITISTMLAVFQYLTKVHLPLFRVMVEPNENGIIPLEDGIMVIGSIALILIGAFPMVHFIMKVFEKPLTLLGNIMGMNRISSAGLIAALANNILVFQILKEMNGKGKLVNCAFAVSASFVFGDHLGFTAGVNEEMVFPVIIGKLTAGILAVVVALLLSNKLLQKME